MSEIQALILGIIQGLTEFLPVSSSGHLELGHALLGVHGHDHLIFAVVVHGATVLSTLVVFRKDILTLFKGLLQFKWNEETRYVLNLLLSAIPVVVLGLCFRKQIEGLFSGDLFFVGCMLLITASLLAFTYFAKSKVKPIRLPDALIIGIAQALAVMPGISRSGSTIATGLILGKKKEDVARFSFLMVLIPILGANFLDLISGDLTGGEQVGFLPLAVGFVAAFVSGLLACSWMINIVKRGKLIYFAAYCLIVGLIAIFAA
ncbi:undecaprenyl-diphosphatase [Mangrovibacterium marinum]|uniref:Undecaprenyl-diphosphatase n=1 Tax=Mangrovibacterium marinum TaxID=1639118 RepID=A0A2T5C699_9BACT|nr:undecaprenyl-diphosphate phosphatase [Mangrovibacterium marinum]PTN10475.1 undecaprenyl-diphosphatase [Mangrovibacterium marinum]